MCIYCTAVVGFSIGVSERESKNNVLNFERVSLLGVSSRMWGTGGYMRHEDKRGTGMGQGKQEEVSPQGRSSTRPQGHKVTEKSCGVAITENRNVREGKRVPNRG
jgi:hypothetical protein